MLQNNHAILSDEDLARVNGGAGLSMEGHHHICAGCGHEGNTLCEDNKYYCQQCIKAFPKLRIPKTPDAQPGIAL